MNRQRVNEIFAEELDKQGCSELAKNVRHGNDNSLGGWAAVRAMLRVVEEVKPVVFPLNLAAFTAEGENPEYISINATGLPLVVEVSVRSRGQKGRDSSVAFIRLPASLFRDLTTAAIKTLDNVEARLGE